MAHFKVQLFCSFVPPGIVPTGAVFQAEEELALSEVEGISRRTATREVVPAELCRVSA